MHLLLDSCISNGIFTRTGKTLFTAEDVVEAPNWSRDGKFLLVNTGGDLYRTVGWRGMQLSITSKARSLRADLKSFAEI